MNYLVVCKPSLSLSGLLIIKYTGTPVLGFYYYLTNYNKVRAINPLSQTFCMPGVQAWLSWVPCSDSQEAALKLRIRAQVSSGGSTPEGSTSYLSQHISEINLLWL